MDNKIYKKGGKLIIEIPFYAPIINPYTETLEGKMNHIIGLIEYKANQDYPDLGFAYTIDRSYKGKEPDNTDFFYKYLGDKKEFIELCNELKIKIIEYPICAYCHNSIYGTFTIGDKGNMCWECSKKKIIYGN